MAALRKNACLAFRSILFFFLTLHTPTYVQAFLDPDDFLEIETTEAERIALPPITTAFPSNEALVLVRTTTLLKEWDHSPILAEIYFDAKRFFLKGKSAQIIEESAKLLHKQVAKTIHIEAVCDKRGTTEYSFVLGHQKAYTVEQYLQNLGITPSQISVVTFGTHQPRCEERSTACWEDTLRINNVFPLLAMNNPKAGCITRLRLNHAPKDLAHEQSASRNPFLQRIHLAESR